MIRYDADTVLRLSSAYLLIGAVVGAAWAYLLLRSELLRWRDAWAVATLAVGWALLWPVWSVSLLVWLAYDEGDT